MSFYFSPSIQQQYERAHGGSGASVVDANDVLFALHALLLCSVTAAQCVMYDRGGQQLSTACKAICSGIVGVAGSVALFKYMMPGVEDMLSWLDFIYGLRWAGCRGGAGWRGQGLGAAPRRAPARSRQRGPGPQLGGGQLCSAAAPADAADEPSTPWPQLHQARHQPVQVHAPGLAQLQAQVRRRPPPLPPPARLRRPAAAAPAGALLHPTRRAAPRSRLPRRLPPPYPTRPRSTDGFNIDNVLLDFTGGVLSTAQTFIDAGASGDWAPIAGNPVKLGLGFVSVAYDLVFMAQHCCLYPQRGEAGRPAAGYARLRSQEQEEEEGELEA